MINVRKVKAAGLCDCCDKKTAKVITALLNADREQKSKFSLACMDAAKRLGCCPACESSNVESVMLLCYPPIIDLRCKKCGWRSR